jgi:hypothetical protein
MTSTKNDNLLAYGRLFLKPREGQISDQIADFISPVVILNPIQSNIIAIKDWNSGAGGVSQQFYTVTAGKVFYLTAISFGNGAGTPKNFGISDGVADGGTLKFRTRNISTDTTFPTPIPFFLGVRNDASQQDVTVAYTGTIIGYEDDPL